MSVAAVRPAAWGLTSIPALRCLGLFRRCGRPPQASAWTSSVRSRHWFGMTRHPGLDPGFRAVQHVSGIGLARLLTPPLDRPTCYGLIRQILLSDCFAASMPLFTLEAGPCIGFSHRSLGGDLRMNESLHLWFEKNARRARPSSIERFTLRFFVGPHAWRMLNLRAEAQVVAAYSPGPASTCRIARGCSSARIPCSL